MRVALFIQARSRHFKREGKVSNTNARTMTDEAIFLLLAVFVLLVVLDTTIIFLCWDFLVIVDGVSKISFL